MSGMEKEVHISDDSITKQVPSRGVGKGGNPDILMRRRYESNLIANMTREKKRQEQEILGKSAERNHRRDSSISMERMENKISSTITEYQKIYDRTRELELKREELTQRRIELHNEDIKRQEEDKELGENFDSNMNCIHDLGKKILENGKRIEHIKKKIAIYENTKVHNRRESYYEEINTAKKELHELEENQYEMNMNIDNLNEEQISITDNKDDIEEKDKKLVKALEDLKNEENKLLGDFERHAKYMVEYDKNVSKSVNAIIIARSIMNEQISQAKEEKSEKLPQTPGERAEETQKIVSQASQISLRWIRLGYVGPETQEDRRELQKQKLRSAAWEYGLKPQDSDQKRKLENLICHALQIHIEEHEIRALVKCWKTLGNYDVKDKEKSIKQPMKDSRYEQYKKELAKKELREFSFNFGKSKKEFEKKGPKLTEIFKASDELQYYMEAIKSCILSEVDRVTGQSSKVNFEDLPIGKECRQVVPLPDNNREEAKGTTLKKKVQRRISGQKAP